MPKVEPSFVKDIIDTIKDSTMSTAVTTSKKIKDSVINFKKEANSWDENVGTVRTCFNLTKHAWKKTFPSTDEEVRNRMERVKK